MTFTPRIRLYDENQLYTQLKSAAAQHGLPQTLRVLPLARQWHAGQTRKGEGNVPYIIHPLTMARQALALGLTEDDLLSALLLHDVAEDCGVSAEDLPVSPRAREVVARVTFARAPGESKEDAKARYFAAIAEDPMAVMVKVIDRCNNVSSMAGGFTCAGMVHYVEETETFILPMAEKTEAAHPEYANALWLLRYQLMGLLETFKHLL